MITITLAIILLLGAYAAITISLCKNNHAPEQLEAMQLEAMQLDCGKPWHLNL